MADHQRNPPQLSYEQACAGHEWRVPERYNIAADVCDRHPRAKPAMLWERYDGATRELTWGELQDLSNQAAHVLREHGVGKGDRVAVVLPSTPEAAAIFFGTWKLGAILLSMSVLYGDEGIRHRLADSGPKVLVTDSANAGRFDPSSVGSRLVLDQGDGLLAGRPTDHICEDTSADDPAQLYYTSGTTGMAKGIVHAHRYILAHEEFVYCHEVEDGERFKAFIVLAEGHQPSDELAHDIKDFVRARLSAYAYPRKVEFVDELPKTLTGKIRRIELREREREQGS